MDGRDSFRSILDAFVADPPARSLETIQQLLTELQYSTAAIRLLARARCGEPVPIDLVREVIACADTLLLPLVLFLLADGDRVAAVVDMIETDAFPHDETGMMATATFVFAAALLDETRESHPRLAIGLRVLAIACLDQPPSPMRTGVITAFQFLAKELQDDLLAAMLRDEISGPVAPALLTVRGLLTLSRTHLVELPALYDARSIPVDCKLDTDYAPALGRNAPCWCQSGKKFKRCHGAEERPPSSRETRSHRAITVVEVQTWPLGDLATMRFRQLGDEQLGAAIERLVKYRAWDVAERALDALAAREHLSRRTRDHVRNHLITRAMQCTRWDLVAKHVAKLSSPHYALMKSTVATLLPVLARAPDAIDRLLEFAEGAANDPTRADGGVALLLHAMPALGLLLVRAEIASGAIEPDRETFIAIDQARAQLGLPPGDPVERLFEQWRAAKAEARDREAYARAEAEARAENDVLREQISETNRQNRELLRRVDDLERQWRERPVEPAAAEPEPDPAEIRALRAKILQLQDIVRDKNLELAELRRDLRAASTERTSPQEPADRGAGERRALDPEAADDRDDRWEVDDAPASERRIRVPIWRPAPMSDIGSLPAHAAREALCTIAELAAGDAATWRAVKRAKRMTTPILMARIGIHHRLLFCVNDSSLEVMELVTRESLHVTLKRYA